MGEEPEARERGLGPCMQRTAGRDKRAAEGKVQSPVGAPVRPRHNMLLSAPRSRSGAAGGLQGMARLMGHGGSDGDDGSVRRAARAGLVSAARGLAPDGAG